MGSTRALTRQLVLDIRDQLGLCTVPHLTCVGSTREEIRHYLQSLKAQGIDRILALRGDPPAGQAHFTPVGGGFAYANELVAFIRDIDGFRITVAGYPEGHIEAPSKEIDLVNLKRKVDAGAEKVITQLFFDNRDYYDFVARARAIGMTVPIVPGVMPIVSLAQISRISSMCGCRLPEALLTKLRACGEDAEAMQQVGVDWALAQVRDLLAHAVPGIHLYILNRAESTEKILTALAQPF